MTSISQSIYHRCCQPRSARVSRWRESAGTKGEAQDAANCGDHTSQSMLTAKIKATYSLDVETVDELERLASRWQTSKSDVIRRKASFPRLK